MTEINISYLHSQSVASFCGRSEIWDSQLTWYGDYPRFTKCFQNTVLLLMPSAVLCLSAVPYIIWLFHSAETHHGTVVGRLFISKIVMTLLVCIASITNVVQAAVRHHSSSESALQADVISPAIRAIAMIVSISILQLSRKRGHVTCGVLFLFWLLELLVGIIPFYIKIMEQDYIHNLFSFVLFYVDYTLVLTAFVLHSFAETRKYIAGGKKPHPERDASTPSLIMFAWVTPLIIRGYKRTLRIGNIWELDEQDTCRTVLSRFEKYKHSYWPQVKNRPGAKPDSSESSECVNERSPLLSSKVDAASAYATCDKRTIPLGKILFRAFACEVLAGHIFTFIYDILAFLYPLLQKLLIDFTNEKNTEQEWKGYLYALAFYIVTFLQPLCMHQFLYRGVRSGLRVQNALIAAIYKKSLVLTSAARNISTTGQIVTLISVDCEHVLNLVQTLWSFWSAPLLMVLSIAMLYMFLGPAIFAGVGVTLFLIPINAVVMNRVERFQDRLMDEKDNRIKTLNEIMDGIRVVKLHAWEPALQQRVDDIRSRELDVLKRMYFVRGFVVIFSTLSPYLVGLATFATYVFTSEDHYLSADKVFVCLILFSIQHDSITSLPQLVTEYARAKVSFRRISEFLSLEEIDKSYVKHAPRHGKEFETATHFTSVLPQHKVKSCSMI